MTRSVSLLLTNALAAATLTGCTILDATRGCEGTDARVKELASLGILGSRPDGATDVEGLEEVDAGCWADSGDVVVYADRTYAYPGTRAEVAAHYRRAGTRDGWSPDPEALPGDLCFTKGGTSLRIVFLTADLLAEDGLGSHTELTTGTGYSINITAYMHSDAAAGC